MTRTITVKGTGKASAKPDLVVLTMDLCSRAKEYDDAMEQAAEHIGQLTAALAGIGFEKDDLKTTGFRVETDYRNEKDRNGNYKSVFHGYAATQNLKLEFDFDTMRLGEALKAVSSCNSHPELRIRFSVRNPAALKEEVLRSAAVNAAQKADILCAASGVKKGALISVDYNWGELDIYSRTQYDNCEMPLMVKACAIDITPEDIDVGDSITFVWEIC